MQLAVARAIALTADLVESFQKWNKTIQILQTGDPFVRAVRRM